MTASRRKLVTRICEATAIGLLALDAALYFALVRPLGSMRMSAEREYTATRDRIRDGKARAARLEEFKKVVPGAETQLASFLKNHVPPRRQGFSHAARLVRKLSEDANVRLTSVTYKLSWSDNDPLPRLALEVEVEGLFPNVLRFAHALETSKEFLALRDFTYEPGETRTIALHLGADLYLRP